LEEKLRKLLGLWRGAGLSANNRQWKIFPGKIQKNGTK